MSTVLSSSSSTTASTSSVVTTEPIHFQQQQKPIGLDQPAQQQMTPNPIAPEDFADGQLQLKIERVSQLQLEQKFIKTAKIARFSWELGALKHNILNEENTPKPYLLVYVQCNERSQRLDGWACTANIKLTLSSDRKTKFFILDQIRFSTQHLQEKNTIHYPWDKLLTEFELCNDTDALTIHSRINIIEQIGYGSLIQLNTKLNIHGNILLVNKFHLATYSSYFQTFFFSEWSKDVEEYQLNDPYDDPEALLLMLNMAYPIENYPHPTDAKISEVLRLADKYDLQIVIERCEKVLMEDTDPRCGPLIQKLAFAERYGLFNLKSHCLERITPAHFCFALRNNIAVYNELSDGLKSELDERMNKRSGEEIQQQSSQHIYQQDIGALPPPHKRVRPRPKTPPRPNYNLPPFRFK